MGRMQITIMLFLIFLTVNLLGADELFQKNTYICNIKGVHKQVVNESTSYFATDNFEIVCGDREIEIENRLGEKWLVWLSTPQGENNKQQVLNLKGLTAENHYKVFSQMGEAELGLAVGKKMEIDCHIKL